MDSDQQTRRAAVIGGGISGLAAATELLQRDAPLRVTLFESSNRTGGVLQTVRKDGFCYELGPDSMLRRLPWGMQLCHRVGLSEEMIPTEPAASGVYTVYRGRLLRMPEGLALVAPRKIWPMVQTPILSWKGKLRMAAERLLPPRREEADESLADFARRRFGEETLQRIIQPMASGIYMGDPELLGMQGSFPQLVAAERQFGSLIKWCRHAAAKTAASNSQPQQTLFTAPRHGFAQLVEAVTQQFPPDTLRLNHKVQRLTPADTGWRVQGMHTVEGQPFDELFDLVVLAAPARHAADLIEETDAALARLLRSIVHSSCVVVNLAYPRRAIRQALDAAGVIVPHVEQRPFTACTFSSEKYHGRAPAGRTLLRVFLGGAHHPETIDTPDDELLHSVRCELESLLQIEGEPVLQHVTRWRDKMPQYYVGHEQLVQEIESRAAQLQGFELIGNAYRGVGIPHCVHYAQQAIERLLAPTSPNASTATPEAR